MEMMKEVMERKLEYMEALLEVEQQQELVAEKLQQKSVGLERVEKLHQFFLGQLKLMQLQLQRLHLLQFVAIGLQFLFVDDPCDDAYVCVFFF